MNTSLMSYSPGPLTINGSPVIEEKLLIKSFFGLEQITTSAPPRTAESPVDPLKGSVIIVTSLPVILKLESPYQDIVMGVINVRFIIPNLGLDFNAVLEYNFSTYERA